MPISKTEKSGVPSVSGEQLDAELNLSPAKSTADGLPIVKGNAYMEFLRNYEIKSPNNDPDVTARIKQENPMLYRMLRLGMEGLDQDLAICYEAGVQITYELLRRQSIENQEP